MEKQKIHIGGSVSGRNVAVGSNININEAGMDVAELTALLGQLRGELEQAPLPPATREAIVEEVLPELTAAASAPDAKPKIESSLGKLNLLLRGAGTATEQIGGIARSAAKIAKVAGVAIGTAAPWLAKLL